MSQPVWHLTLWSQVVSIQSLLLYSLLLTARRTNLDIFSACEGHQSAAKKNFTLHGSKAWATKTLVLMSDRQRQKGKKRFSRVVVRGQPF